LFVVLRADSRCFSWLSLELLLQPIDHHLSSREVRLKSGAMRGMARVVVWRCEQFLMLGLKGRVISQKLAEFSVECGQHGLGRLILRCAGFDELPESVCLFPDFPDQSIVLRGVLVEARKLFPQRLDAIQTRLLVDSVGNGVGRFL
jgi:hypothetical protein